MSKKLLAVLLTLAVLMSITAAAASAEASGMTPGEYTATVSGMKGDMTVKVTVDETSIQSVEILDTVDTVQIVGAVIDSMIPEMLEKQSVNVDSVTGATFSSFVV